MTDTHTGLLFSILRFIPNITRKKVLQMGVASPCMKVLCVPILVSLVMPICMTEVQADTDLDWDDAVAYLGGLDNNQKAIEEYNNDPQGTIAEYKKIKAQKEKLEAAGWVLKNPLQHYDTLTYCEKEILKAPENPKLYYNKAKVLTRMGRYETALEAIDHAIQIDPAYAHAWSQKGVLLEKMGHKQEADAAYDRVKALESK